MVVRHSGPRKQTQEVTLGCRVGTDCSHMHPCRTEADGELTTDRRKPRDEAEWSEVRESILHCGL